MIIDNINLNHLRIFESVYRAKSMTIAAKELHLTQSGVSQHIKSLEEVLGVKLFDRIKQRLIPTAPANLLFKKSVESLYEIEQTLSEIRGGEQLLTGTVSIGMPIEFGNNMIMPLLSRFCKDHPAVQFGFRYGFATEMNDGILSGNLDFAFVDSFGLDKRITTEDVYDEDLHLCCSPELLKGKPGVQKADRKFFEGLPFVDYQPGEPVLRLWFEHHLGTRHLSLNVRATVMDVQGIARLILSGLGAGVLPGHLVSKLEKEGTKIHRFKGRGKALKNTIRVAYLAERTSSLSANSVRSWLLSSLENSPEM